MGYDGYVSVEVVEATNTVPVAVDDVPEIVSGGSVGDLTTNNIPAGGGVSTLDPLANDLDADGDQLTFGEITLPPDFPGTITVNDSNSEYGEVLLLTLNPDFVGFFSFTYRAFDGVALSEPATVTHRVNLSPNYTAPSAQTFTVGVEATVDLGSFVDPDEGGFWHIKIFWRDSEPDLFTVYSEGDIPSITHTFTEAGVYSAPYNGISFAVYDEDYLAGYGYLAVTVVAPNEPPVVMGESITVSEGSTVRFNVLANDSDPDGDTLLLDYDHIEADHGGSFMVGGVGNPTYPIFMYAPDDGYVGPDAFTYYVEDGNGGRTAGVVTIDVVAGRECGDDTATTTRGSAVTIDVLGNDVDRTGDPTVVSGLYNPDYGTVDYAGLEENGYTQVTYTPAVGFTGIDTFRYIGADVTADDTDTSCFGTVTVTVGELVPVPEDDAIQVPQGARIIFRVTDNDFNPGYGSLRIVDVTQPATLGTVSIEEYAFRLDYQAPMDAFGTDKITYTVEDSNGNTGTGMVTIEVVEGLACVDDAVTVLRGRSVNIDVLENDPGLDGDTSPSVSEDLASLRGQLIAIDNTTFSPRRYTAPSDFTGNDVYTYENRVEKDGYNLICGATVTITVLERLPILTAPPDQTAVEGKVKRFGLGSFFDQSGAGAGPWDVMVDWGDGSSENLSSLTSEGYLGSALHTFPTDGDITVTVTVENAAGLTGSVTFTVEVSNAAPTLAAGYAQTVTQGRSTAIRLGYFVDPGSTAPWTVTVDWGDATTPESFPVSTTGNIQSLHTYSAEGSYPVTVVVTDGDGASSPSRSFTVTVVNAAPTLVAVYNQQVAQGRSTSIGLGYFVDPGSVAPWTVTVDWGDGTVEAPAIESFSAGAPGTIRAAHSYAAVGTFPVAVYVTDGQGLRSVTKSFTVTSANAPPIMAAGYNRTVTRGVATTIFLGYFSDPASGVPWTVTVDWGDGAAGAPAVETFSMDTAGNIRSAHTYATLGTYRVTVFVTDGDGARSVSRSFTVTAANAAPTLAAGSNQTVRRGTPASINLGYFVDPGSGAPWTVTVVWGDGSTPTESFQVSAIGTIRATHTYGAPGSYTVTVYVTDGEGGRSVSRSLTITVT